MTPQTPQGAALSDADIDEILSQHPIAPRWPIRFARAIEAKVIADRRLTAEQPEEPIRMAYKTGYDEGYSDGSDGSSDHDACEEGWQQYRASLTPVTAEQGGADLRTALSELCDAADATNYPRHGPAWDRLWNCAVKARAALTTQPQAEPTEPT